MMQTFVQNSIKLRLTVEARVFALLLTACAEVTAAPASDHNGVTLDFIRAETQKIIVEYYAFLVSEEEFDKIFARIRARRLTYWADPAHAKPREINRNDAARGVYWNDPNGHCLEIITRPSGSGD